MKYKAADFISGTGVKCDRCGRKIQLQEFSVGAFKRYLNAKCSDCGHGPLINRMDIALARIVLFFAWMQAVGKSVGLLHGPTKTVRISSAPDEDSFTVL